MRARFAPRESILSAAAQLEKQKIMGMVLNDVHRVMSRHDYEYGYYSKRDKSRRYKKKG